jgi:hypothetical protein
MNSPSFLPSVHVGLFSGLILSPIIQFPHKEEKSALSNEFSQVYTLYSPILTKIFHSLLGSSYGTFIVFFMSPHQVVCSLAFSLFLEAAFFCSKTNTQDLLHTSHCLFYSGVHYLYLQTTIDALIVPGFFSFFQAPLP